jgi:hypothetical protein
MVAVAGMLLDVDAQPADSEPVADRVADPNRAFTIEAVREGYLMHYGQPRALEVDDPDLALLGGDTLYALGLAWIAERGDLEAVAELADLISLCAVAQAEGRPDLAEAVWRASTDALGEGGKGARATFESLTREG